MKTGFFSYLRAMLLFMATFVACYAFGQTPALGSEAVAEADFTQYFVTFAAFVAVVPFIVEGLKHAFNTTKGWVNILISWVTGLIVAIAAHFLNLGVFGDFTILQTIVTGFGASLAANGVFDSGIITKILELLIPKLRKK